MQAGKTIAAKRERPESDSERDRARRAIRKRKIIAVSGAILLGASLIYLSFRAFQEWIRWASTKEEVIVIERVPSVEIIDDETGKKAETVTSRIREYVVNLEEEFALRDMKIKRVRIPKDKIREIDVEVEDFSGMFKVSIDRNPAVSAEDAKRMLKYLDEEDEDDVEYVDIRLERKAYWK